nr:uncharacterized protein LOC123757403 [Procambarus clarkii]
MTTNDNQMVNRILGELNRKITAQIHQNAEIVDSFVSALRAQLMNSHGTLLSKANIMHSGSAYETLSVKVKTDFDIVLVLPTPYQVENFKVERDPSHFLRLIMNPNSTAKSYLDAAKLQSQLFEELHMCLKRVSVPGVRSVSGKKGLAAYTVEIITTSGTKISVDLGPQIAARAWGEYLRPLKELSAKLQDYVKMLERNASPIYLLIAAVPGNHPNQNFLFSISFSMLEKEFLRSNRNIRDMVKALQHEGTEAPKEKPYTSTHHPTT